MTDTNAPQTAGAPQPDAHLGEHASSDQTFTPEEHQQIRDTAFATIAYVSAADPGFFSTFSESMAGSRALAEAPAAIKDLLKQGGFPSPPKARSIDELASTVTSMLGQTMQLLQSRNPEQAQSYREVLLSAADRVAQASGGVTDKEQEALTKVRTALQEHTTGTTNPTSLTTPPPGSPASPQQADDAEAPLR